MQWNKKIKKMFNVSGFGVHEVDACSIPGSP